MIPCSRRPGRFLPSFRLRGSALLALLVVLAATRSPAQPAPGHGLAPAGRSGVWGELVRTRILIEPPDEFLAEDYTTPASVRWVFPGYPADALDRLWTAAGLTAMERRLLAGCTRVDPATGARLVVPPGEFVLGLSRSARTTIYNALAAFVENPAQQEPFRFRATTEEEWFDHSGLAPTTVATVRRLLYRRGTSLLFSDHDLVLPMLPNRAERLKLVKTLARKSTLLLQLRVTPDSDLEGLAAYWGRGPRRKDVGALLRSLARRPGDTLIDVAHLLPRFPRARLFTYPTMADHAGDTNYDCHWTSLNFFNDAPDHRFADAAVVQATLENDYTVVDGPRELGDILVFFRADGKAIHSCVYVADDVVFTKNGSAQVMPWMLMDLPDVIAFYPSDPPLRVRAFRHRGFRR